MRAARSARGAAAPFVTLAMLFGASAPGAAADTAAAAASTAPVIAVRIDGEKPVPFDAAALAALPQHDVAAQAHGKTFACSGPDLFELAAKVGAPGGEALRGQRLEYVVRVGAADGYHVEFALAELDPAMREAVPIVTARCNGAALDAKDAPFRVIVPGDKRPARWIRQVQSVEIFKASAPP